MVQFKSISIPNEKPKIETIVSTKKRTILFPPLQDVIDFDYNAPQFLKHMKRNGSSYVLLRILQKFRETEERDPSYKDRADDIAKLLAIRNDIAADLVTDSSFIHVFSQISPAVAIVGGELSQEIIKAVSKKEAPHNNVFLFDPDTCCGFVESIGI